MFARFLYNFVAALLPQRPLTITVVVAMMMMELSVTSPASQCRQTCVSDGCRLGVMNLLIPPVCQAVPRVRLLRPPCWGEAGAEEAGAGVRQRWKRLLQG